MSINGKLFLWVLSIVRENGAATLIEQLLKPDPSRGGRPRAFGLDTWLTAFVVAVMTGRGAYETRAHEVLTEELPRSLQMQLGVRRRSPGVGDGTTPITIRQIREPLHRLGEHLDQAKPGLTDIEVDYRRRTLAAITSRMAAATVPAMFRLRGEYSLDNTALQTWARPWTREEHDGVISVDRDARWGHRTPTYDTGDRSSVFGYHAATLTTACEDAPAFIEATEARPANENGADSSVRLARMLAADHAAAGRRLKKIIADREYSYSDPENWHDPLRDLGAELVFDIHPNDRGTEYYRGILFLDGTAFCPGLPKDLWAIERPPRIILGPKPGPDDPIDKLVTWERTKKALDAAREITRKRQPFELVRSNGNGAGKERFACQAWYGKAVCALRAFSMQLPDASRLPEVTPPPLALRPSDGICYQQTVTVPADVVPKTRQRHPWLSDRWAAEYSKRPVVERGYASVKHRANEGVDRGWIELQGLVKVSFMFGVAAMSQNLRLALSYVASASQPIPEPCVILRGPGKTHGHEELDELGAIALYQDIDHPAL